MTIDEAIALVRQRWDEEGACGSCGWHAALYEYGELAYAITIDKRDGCIRLPCLSDDAEDAWSHRGVRIWIDSTADGDNDVR